MSPVKEYCINVYIYNIIYIYISRFSYFLQCTTASYIIPISISQSYIETPRPPL